MARQVRLDDEICDWLAGQGGSLSAAATRTLWWAREAIEAAEEVDASLSESAQNGSRNGQYDQAARAGKPTVRTSAGATRRRMSFSPIIRRST